MKRLYFLFTLVALSLLSNGWAEEYKTPKLKKMSSKTKKVKVKKENWESSYRVQDEFESERGLASEKDKKPEKGRNPSSRPKSTKPKANSWQYHGRH